MNRYLHEIANGRTWAGRPAFVIGGGPSLKGFDFDSLRGYPVITCNKSWRSAPWAALNVTIDADFIVAARNDSEWKAQQALRVAICKRSWEGHREDGGLWRVDDLGDSAWSDDIAVGVGTGWNTGYAAANIAWALGARPVYLLGIDGGTDHYHEGYDPKQFRPANELTSGYHAAAWRGLVARVPLGDIVHYRNPTTRVPWFPHRMRPIEQSPMPAVVGGHGGDWTRWQTQLLGVARVSRSGVSTLSLSRRVMELAPEALRLLAELHGSDVDVAVSMWDEHASDDVVWLNDTHAATLVKAELAAKGSIGAALLAVPSARIIGLPPELCWYDSHDYDSDRWIGGDSARRFSHVREPAIRVNGRAPGEAPKPSPRKASDLPPLDKSLNMMEAFSGGLAAAKLMQPQQSRPIEVTPASLRVSDAREPRMRYVATLFKPVDSLPQWSRSAYSPQYADWFAENVRRFSPRAEVVIVTDYDEGEFSAGQRIVPFVLPHRGWASLLEMFRPEVVGDAAILMGLDTVCVGDLTPIERDVREFGNVAVEDPFEGGGKMSNAVVGVDVATALGVWQAWLQQCDEALADARYRMFGVFSEMLWLRQFAWTFASPQAVSSYKAHVAPRGTPDPLACIVYFHGEPKPHQIGDQWLTKVWGPHAGATAATAR